MKECKSVLNCHWGIYFRIVLLHFLSAVGDILPESDITN
jgi:hypothetical protein